jgi:hypothetical protein
MTNIKFNIILYYAKDKAQFFPTRKSKIWPILTHEVWKSCYIKVTYAPGIYNHGAFDNVSEARQFIQECTEPALLKHAKEGVWK